MKTKETWIDETMNSVNAIGRATAAPGLFLKVQVKMEHQEDNAVLFRRLYYWPVAAGIAVLITLNILGALYYQHVQVLSQQVPAAVVTDYLSYLGPIKL